MLRQDRGRRNRIRLYKVEFRIIFIRDMVVDIDGRYAKHLQIFMNTGKIRAIHDDEGVDRPFHFLFYPLTAFKVPKRFRQSVWQNHLNIFPCIEERQTQTKYGPNRISIGANMPGEQNFFGFPQTPFYSRVNAFNHAYSVSLLSFARRSSSLRIEASISSIRSACSGVGSQ